MQDWYFICVVNLIPLKTIIPVVGETLACRMHCWKLVRQSQLTGSIREIHPPFAIAMLIVLLARSISHMCAAKW